jgi:hypothetical protein
MALSGEWNASSSVPQCMMATAAAVAAQISPTAAIGNRSSELADAGFIFAPVAPVGRPTHRRKRQGIG